MCGRYVQTQIARYKARLLDLAREADPPRAESWNVAPSTLALVVRLLPPKAKLGGPGTPRVRVLPGSAHSSGTTGSDAISSGRPIADWLSWGLQGNEPIRAAWADINGDTHAAASGEVAGEGTPFRPINARLESVAEKPTFREAWKTRRCLIPADGWYEWKTESDALPVVSPKPGHPRARSRAGTRANVRKQPYYFHCRDGHPLYLAALWTGDTYCLLTTPADGHLTQIHHRRPLTLRDDLAPTWLQSAPTSTEAALAAALPPAAIAFHPVSINVSNPRKDEPALIEPVGLELAPEFLPGL